VIWGIFSKAWAIFWEKRRDLREEVILAEEKGGLFGKVASLKGDEKKASKGKEFRKGDVKRQNEKDPQETTEKDAKGRSWKEEKRKVLESIIEEAKKGDIKHQELYLKYIDHFLGGNNGDEEVIYTAEFVDDEKKET